jgi:CPA2 family monovalent cation:H+ antiporter-2
MTNIHFLRELIIVLTATIAIVFVFQKLRFPTIVGFLLAGVIIGPHGLGLVRSAGQVDTLAEIGLVLLLFTIGLEFSLEQILGLQKRIISAGLLQVGLTIAVVLTIALLFGASLEVGVFYGFLVALSSTAIVLRLYKEREEINSIQGRLAAGILLIQDICIVPMILLVPILAHTGRGSLLEVGWTLLKTLLALALIIWLARKWVPRLLHEVALLRNREIFVLFVVLVCLGTAWLTSETGLSLALGALVAGIVVSESELSHQIVADILPLRHTFSGIFFISIGMLLDTSALARDIVTPVIELLLMIGIKSLVIFVLIWTLYRSVRLAVLLALSLAQIGEFSFILAKTGIAYGLLSPIEEQTFLAASILSMIATPFLLRYGSQVAYGVQGMTGPGKTALASARESHAAHRALQSHVVIVGYGLNGQNLARVLKEVGIPYRILEMDPDLFRMAKGAAEPILFGDATRPEILRDAGIAAARVLVIAISDPLATARVVSQARALMAGGFIIVRTRYVAEIEHLYRLGANQVIPEEFETSIEIFARVLQEFHVPRNVISLQVDLIRREHYGTLRGLRLEGKQLDALNQFLVGTTTDIFSIMDGSPVVGKNLLESEIQSRCGVTIIAVIRDGKPYHDIRGDFCLAVGDMLVLMGNHKALDDAAKMLRPQTDNYETSEQRNLRP